MKANNLQYLLITPAQNEEAFLEFTILSVAKQTVRPVRWLIVSDGSTDRTDEIVTRLRRGGIITLSTVGVAPPTLAITIGVILAERSVTFATGSCVSPGSSTREKITL